MKNFVFAVIIILVVTFAELLGVSDGGPDDHCRDGFVGAGRGLDILIPAPEMEKGFPLIPPSTRYLRTLMAPFRIFFLSGVSSEDKEGSSFERRVRLCSYRRLVVLRRAESRKLREVLH